MAKMTIDIFNQKFDKFKDSVQTSLNNLNPLKPTQTTHFYHDNNDDILKKGWLLMKLEDSQEMHLKWCILNKACLDIFSNMDSLAHRLHSIPLVGTTCKQVVDVHQDYYLFNLTTASNEKYSFASKSLETFEQWLAILNKICHKSIFGQPLEEVLFVDPHFEENSCICSFKSNNLPASVPFIVLSLTQNIEQRGLNEEGIFRVSGSVKEMRKLCELINNEHETYDLNSFDIHVVASVFKKFLRDLPKPLIIESMYEMVTTTVNRSMVLDADEALSSLHSCLQLLTPCHFNLLHFLCAFLYHVSLHSSFNKMTIENLSTIFVNAIIRPDDGEDVELLIATVAPRTAVCAVLIAHYDKLFGANFSKRNNNGMKVDEGDLLGLGEMRLQNDAKNKSKSLALELLGFGCYAFTNVVDEYVSNLIDLEDINEDNHPFDEQDCGDRRGMIFSKNTKNKIIIQNQLPPTFPLKPATSKNESSPYPILPLKPNFIKQEEIYSNGVLMRNNSLKNKTINCEPLKADKQLAKRRSLLAMQPKYVTNSDAYNYVNIDTANGQVGSNNLCLVNSNDIIHVDDYQNILLSKNNSITLKSDPTILDKITDDCMLELSDGLELINVDYIDKMSRDQLTCLVYRLLNELKFKNSIINDLTHK